MVNRAISFLALLFLALPIAANADDDYTARLLAAREMMAANGYQHEIDLTLHKYAAAYARRWRFANPTRVDIATENCLTVDYEGELRTSLPKAMEAEANVYAQTYSLAELRYMINYYESPMGKQITAKYLRVFQQNQDLQIDWSSFAAGRAVRDAGMLPLYDKSIWDRIAADLDSYSRAPLQSHCKLEGKAK